VDVVAGLDEDDDGDVAEDWLLLGRLDTTSPTLFKKTPLLSWQHCGSLLQQ
jgi:hypothetical protein